MENYPAIRSALNDLVTAMTTLRANGVLDSKRDLNGQFGEWFVKTMYDGQYAPNKNRKHWDIQIGEKRVQVKAHAKDSTNNNRYQFDETKTQDPAGCAKTQRSIIDEPTP